MSNIMLPHQQQQHQLPPHHQLSPHQLPPHSHHLQQHQQQPHVRQPHVQQQQQPPQQQLHQDLQRQPHQHLQQYQQAPPELSHQGHTFFIGTKDGRDYKLVCEQQPIRARMCGFGDKDRRPITPPPCVRLLVIDHTTQMEIDPGEVDSTYFVLMVDLWHEDGTRAVNLVRHSSAAPTVSISSSTVTSYPPPPERQVYAVVNGHSQWHDPMGRAPPPPTNQYGQPAMPQSNYYPTNPGNAAYGYGGPNGYGQNPISIPTQTPAQNHTRNLIGMNAVNACRLKDTKDKLGFWFVLQDLSVRTEGTFRLKLSMCDVSGGAGPNAPVSDGKCPILATIFSDPFTVYSAKKFPGVIESTELSKCFAQQGIKIPIRKDGPKSLSNQAEYDADDI